jgi:hypothetical protein
LFDELELSRSEPVSRSTSNDLAPDGLCLIAQVLAALAASGAAL